MEAPFKISSTRRFAAGFTLIELLVVIAIIALLIGILLPALQAARVAGQTAVSLSNLRSHGQTLAVYEGEFDGMLINPFFDKGEQERFNLREWTFVDDPNDNGIGRGWSFSASTDKYLSEFYGFHWYSVTGRWLSEQSGWSSEAQFHPRDIQPYERFNELREATNRDGSSVVDDVIWDTSYIYTPTAWFASERFRDDDREVVNKFDADLGQFRRNRTADVKFPAAKVIFWERFDFTKNNRQQLRMDENFGTTSVGTANAPPQWNNPQARPHATTQDGSATKVDVNGIYQRMEDEKLERPSGFLWQPSSVALNRYSMFADDNIEHGGSVANFPSTHGVYPAIFWATRDGIKGRDLAR